MVYSDLGVRIGKRRVASVSPPHGEHTKTQKAKNVLGWKIDKGRFFFFLTNPAPGTSWISQ